MRYGGGVTAVMTSVQAVESGNCHFTKATAQPQMGIQTLLSPQNIRPEKESFSVQEKQSSRIPDICLKHHQSIFLPILAKMVIFTKFSVSEQIFFTDFLPRGRGLVGRLHPIQFFLAEKIGASKFLKGGEVYERKI